MNQEEINYRREAQIAKLIELNRDRFIDVYPDDESLDENPVPEDTHCIVIFQNKGWLEIHKTEEMGLEALIATEWIKYEDLLA